MRYDRDLLSHRVLIGAKTREVPSLRGRQLRVQHILCSSLVLLLLGCDRLDMYDQPRYEPLEASHFFQDGLSARPPIEGTIARGSLREDAAFYSGKEGKTSVSQIPEAAYRTIAIKHSKELGASYEDIASSTLRQLLLERGKQRFEIYCSVCHGRTGNGDGMVVRRGFRRPPSYHIDRLRQVAAGHFVDVMTNGFGAMASYANRIDAADRWAIAAYIRALQLSQSATLEDVPDEQRDVLLNAPIDPEVVEQLQKEAQ